MKFIGKSGKTIVEHLQDMLNEPALFAEMTGYQTDAVREAIKTLAEDNNVPVKQPDPITGLVPCGCGGDAVRNGMSFFHAYVTSCSECGTLAWSKSSQQEADNNWNVAMGYAAPKKEVVK